MLVRLWGFYARGLRQHHQGEDRAISPLVTSRQPDFADVESDMRSEHHTVDELLVATEGAFGTLGIPAGEMAKIEKGFLREVPRRDLGLLLAALDATAKEHPELHLPPVPKPALLLLSLVWRRRYAALVAQATA